jgi:hypothetical protein
MSHRAKADDGLAKFDPVARQDAPAIQPSHLDPERLKLLRRPAEMAAQGVPAPNGGPRGNGGY